MVGDQVRKTEVRQRRARIFPELGVSLLATEDRPGAQIVER
jgi:hypothetical protein